MKTTAKQIGIILLASGLLAVVANWVHPRSIPWAQSWDNQVEERAHRQKIKIIPMSVAAEWHASREATFIDARTSDAFDKGHIPGALSVPLEQFEAHFSVLAEALDSGRAVVVYCVNRECDDALLLAVELQHMGGTNAVLFIDGYMGWMEHGGEVSR